MITFGYENKGKYKIKCNPILTTQIFEHFSPRNPKQL
ncbi:MAG: hypothetical protein UZ09_BCD002002114 [Bacteroidetes bacterium OLB9]|nr:MAG: hypothetical protein UZ09_BCD002002114 [Bacteroidetes bacterium OLB9]